MIEIMKENSTKEAVIWNNKTFTYQDLLNRYAYWFEYLIANTRKGAVVGVRADYSPDSIGLMLALIAKRDIFVPFSFSNKDIEEKLIIAEVEYYVDYGKGDERLLQKTSIQASHALINKLRKREHPGVIVFSSGSTGKPKAALHDFSHLLNKFKSPRATLRSINFLLYDHWGGINTLLYILSNAGLVGVPQERNAEEVCKFIQNYKIELLPTTPTFLNLILMSKAYLTYDISSLKVISYGTEMMPETTLKSFSSIFPDITLKQTYGLTELGVMRTKSKSNDSLWLKVGGEDYKTKIVDNTLFIKAKTSILGYLNAPSPFDSEGWYNTGDRVEAKDGWIRFLGRESDIINVGGQKVFPVEVESILMEISNIQDVSVFAVPNPIMGSVVGAEVVLVEDEAVSLLKKRIRNYLQSRIDGYKIPVVISIAQRHMVTDRFKKSRKIS